MSKDFVLYGGFVQPLNDRLPTSGHTGELSVKYPKLGGHLAPSFAQTGNETENSRWMNTRNQISFLTYYFPQVHLTPSFGFAFIEPRWME